MLIFWFYSYFYIFQRLTFIEAYWELKSIEKNNNWELVPLPWEKKFIRVKLVYKVKISLIDELVKHKARLVERQFLQRLGVDIDKVFPYVARLESVRIVVAFASLQRSPMYQLDVKSTILNGELEGNNIRSHIWDCESWYWRKDVQVEASFTSLEQKDRQFLD